MGGQVNSFYLRWDEMFLWELVELIEITNQINNQQETADPVGDWLAGLVANKQSK